MKKTFYIFLIFNFQFLIFNCFAQQPTQEWVRRYSGLQNRGAHGLSVRLDSLGFIYVLAKVSTDTSYGDFCVLKYNQSGTLMWQAIYNSPGNLDDYAWAFTVSPLGDVYVAGISGINFEYHMRIVKFNTSGILKWAKLFNGGGTADGATDIATDRAGNIVVIGGSSSGGIDYALTVKYNNNGDTLWVRKFNQTANSNGFSKLALDDSNNVYAGGRTGGDYLVVKYNQSGSLVWYGTWNSPENSYDVGSCISVDGIGNVYVVGTTAVPFSSYNNTLVKFNSNGQLQWYRIFTGIVSGNGRCGIPGGILSNSSGTEVYFGTSVVSPMGGWDIATLKFNSAGDSQWVKTFRGGPVGIPAAPIPSGMKMDIYGYVYICGGANFAGTGDDYVTIKYSSSGIQQWVARYSGIITNGGDGASDLFLDTALNVYVTGTSRNASNNGWEVATIKYSQPTGIISHNNQLPREFKLFQNYPNPFNQLTIINYQLSITTPVKLAVFDVLGKEVVELVNDKQPAGNYSARFDGMSFPSGVYFYKMIVEGRIIDTKKLVLIK
jgi:hypothetical protein